MIYYGYERGDDDKIVDWSGVTKSLTDRIDVVEAKRAANRKRIEGEIADATQKISDVPMGNYESMNSFMIQTSTDIAENLRVNSALLRAGKMKASEWAKFSQNSLDAIGQYKKIAENYNSLRDKGVSRLNEGKSGWQEAHELERLEKLADLTKTVSVQDPITGVTFNAPIGKDGRPDMSQAESTLYLANMPFVEMNKFDMNAQLDPTVEKYGENVEVIKSLGVNTKSSIKIRKDFEESVNTFIGSFDSRQLASVLGDFIGGYKGTTDESLAKSKPEEYILIGRDGSNGNFPTYKLTPDQETKAREAIKEQLYMKLDYVETPEATTGSGQTEAERKAGESRKLAVDSINTLADWYGAKTTKDRAAAAAGLASSFGRDFLSLEPSADGKTATFTFIDRSGGNLRKRSAEIRMDVPFDQFIKDFGKALTGQDLSQYYNDFVKSGRTVETFEMQSPETGSYELKFEEPPKDLSQELADVGAWRTNVVKTVDDIKVSEGIFGVSDEKVNESFETAITENLLVAGISDYDVSREGNNITIKVDGLGEISVAVGRKDTDKARVKKILSDVYTRVSKGEMIDGSGKPDGNKLLYPEWKKQNPNGTQKEYLSYFNS